MAAYEAAQGVFIRAEAPRQWAIIEMNRGTALALLGSRPASPGLAEAAAACRAVLDAPATADHPRMRAQAQKTLQRALAGLAAR